MSQYSPATLSLLVRLWFNTSIQCWQGELKEIAGNKTIRFTGLDHLGQIFSQLTETEGLNTGTKTNRDPR